MSTDLLTPFELHSPDAIREALAAGASPVESIKGKRPIDWLIEMYTRTNKFADCLRVMLDAGATVDDEALEAVLLDDDVKLRTFLQDGNALKRLSLECAYTSLHGATLLHVCAEYNSVRCARALLDAGIDVNVTAEIDDDGLGGHTPLFHTVNSNRNYCRPMMELLIAAGADLELRLRGVIWGGGFEWETVVYDVTPFSYAQCGLYRQFHRSEHDVYSNLDFLYRARYGVSAPSRNVPNKYLAE